MTTIDEALAQLTAEIAEVRQRLSGEFSRYTQITAGLAQLEQKLDQAIAGEQIPGPSAPSWLIDDAAGYDAQVAALREWIDRVLLPEYGPYVTWLRPCWPSHRPVLWELSLAWAYWRRAYDRSKPSLPDAIYWHDRLLPGISTRLEPLMASCGGNGRCRLAR